jgi:hypothetical protein
MPSNYYAAIIFQKGFWRKEFPFGGKAPWGINFIGALIQVFMPAL